MLRAMGFKLPESVLVVVHTAQLEVLLLERAAQPGFWQSVTGSREPGDPDLSATARRELLEETLGTARLDFEWFRGAGCAACNYTGYRGRMVLYKAMCDLLWTLWGVIQVVNENPADDFWAYATGRFERCKTLMGGADFGTHVEAVRRA